MRVLNYWQCDFCWSFPLVYDTTATQHIHVCIYVHTYAFMCLCTYICVYVSMHHCITSPKFAPVEVWTPGIYIPLILPMEELFTGREILPDIYVFAKLRIWLLALWSFIQILLKDTAIILGWVATGMYVRTYIYTYMYVHMYICICVHMRICVCVYTYIHLYTYVHMYMRK